MVNSLVWLKRFVRIIEKETLLADCIPQKDTNVKSSAFVKKKCNSGILFFNADLPDSLFQL